MIPLQLPSYEEKKSNIEEIYLKLNTSLLFKFHSILYLCDFMDFKERILILFQLLSYE